MATRDETGHPPGQHSQGAGGPNTAQLKHDIDSGATGDKVELPDPGAAPLGTCDEAAGTPPTAERVAIARQNETSERWAFGKKAGYPHHRGNGALYGFVGLIAAVAVVVLGVFWIG